MRLTPEPPSSPVIAMATGETVYQPAEQAALSQLMLLVGAAASDWAVKPVPALDSPALFCAVTEPVCVPAVLSKV